MSKNFMHCNNGTIIFNCLKITSFFLYYLGQDDSKQFDIMLNENNERLDVAREYLFHLNSSQQNFPNAERNVVICLVSIRRNTGGSYNPNYLLQSSTSFHRAISEEQRRSGRQEFSLMIFDTNSATM